MITANLSGGRDSSAMVVKWLEIGNTLDYILFCDTKYEFKEMYAYIDKLDSYLQRNFNKSITRLSFDNDKFVEWGFEKPITKGDRAGKYRGIPRTLGRDYCTRELKIKPSVDFITSKSPNKLKNTALIGYTYDEVERGRVSNLEYAIVRYPLHEWQMNEAECEAFLRERSIANPLYRHFTRTGCFLCPKQSKKAYYKLFKYYPKEWALMKEWETRAKSLNCVNQTFRIGQSLEALEKAFKETTDELFNDEYAEQETCFCKN